jgi:phage-related minor tail protein
MGVAMRCRFREAAGNTTSQDPTTEDEERIMDETSFQEKMNNILERIRDLPAAQAPDAAMAAEDVEARRARVQHSMGELQEALDYLRLSVKYLVFDLEATRRENAYLRRIIEQSNRQRNRPPEPPADETREDERPDFGANGWE